MDCRNCFVETSSNCTETNIKGFQMMSDDDMYSGLGLDS